MLCCPRQLVFIDVLCRVSNYTAFRNNKKKCSRANGEKSTAGLHKSCHTQFSLEQRFCTFHAKQTRRDMIYHRILSDPPDF